MFGRIERNVLAEFDRRFTELEARLALSPRVRPSDSLSIRGEAERRLVRSFRDFLRAGIPLDLIAALVALTAIPRLWPF